VPLSSRSSPRTVAPITTSTVTGTTGYDVIDAGFDLLRSPGYKLGVFVGYLVVALCT